MKKGARLIIIRGPPGSGKSTVSKEVGKRLRKKVIVFNKDSFMLGLNYFKLDQKIREGGFIFPIVEANLKKGINVIIDGIYGGENGSKKLDALRKLAKKHNSKFYVFTLNCSFKTSVARVRSRKGHIVRKDFPKNEIKRWYNYVYQTCYLNGANIDTGKLNMDQVIKEILKVIK